jgi:hypothetical protein
MKNHFKLFLFSGVLFCLSISAYSQADKTRKADITFSDTGEKNNSIVIPKLLGKWEIDSLVFVNNGVRGNASPPIFPTFWEVKAMGEVIISGGNNFSTTYTVEDLKHFTLILAGVELNYEIKEITKEKLIVESIIMVTKEIDMRTLTYFSKK